MQHSGYVDSVPKYRERDFRLKSHVFNRFSSVNIGSLFTEGEDYLLEYDCLVLGTNATSDDDVYSVLTEEKSRALLARYLGMGKGLLICSQKKLKREERADGEGLKPRPTHFLPERYEYCVFSRPSEEDSSDGYVNVIGGQVRIGEVGSEVATSFRSAFSACRIRRSQAEEPGLDA